MSDNDARHHKPYDPLSDALAWDWGTAYEILLSLDTILRPKTHGLSAPWAAGVRKRLSPQAQADFKSFWGPPYGAFTFTPMHLVFEMEEPKDSAHFLEYVEAIPGEDFTRRLHAPRVRDPEVAHVLDRALDSGELSDTDVEEFRRAVARVRAVPAPSAAEVRRLFAELANPVETRKRWLSVMREYRAVFFAQEEERIRPVLRQMLEDAQALSQTTTVTDLIERLSNGFTISQESHLSRLVLVPSVWCHPFVMSTNLSEQEVLLAWGARPAGYRLAPGESVPSQAMLVLRALGDPTRLRLMRLLSLEPRTPQALARELKLTLPTVSHHMRELRLAGLVRLEARLSERGRENRYTVRWQSAEQAFGELARFVMVDGPKDS